MNKSYFYRRSIKQWVFIFFVLLIVYCSFSISVFAQSIGHIELLKSIQLINPHPVFSLNLRLEKGESASYVPGERMVLSFESTKDAYVTIYQYDSEGRVIIIFPNQSNPHNFVRGEHLYQVSDLILPLESGFGPGYIQAFATTRPLLMLRDNRYPDLMVKEFPIISFKLGDFTINLRSIFNQQPPQNWVSSNTLEYQIVRPHYVSEKVGRVVAISTPKGAEVYLDNEYQGISPKRVEDVRTGQHLLEFIMPGYETWDKTITISSNKTTQMEANLVPVDSYGEISLTCDQPNALVFVDGIEYGKTAKKGTFIISNIKEGYHELTVMKPGSQEYRTWTQTVRVLGGETLPIYVFLTKSNSK
ncbi:MAG TPA: PEGA domain-containing protein [Atribacterota bacterium]|nr:PEGA domain-containing protein [Atribacterota bacterium]